MNIYTGRAWTYTPDGQVNTEITTGPTSKGYSSRWGNMSQPMITLTSFVFTNKTGANLTLVLEPEGDCIAVPDGQTCRLVPAATPAEAVECEVVAESDKSLTVYLAAVKEVYIGSEQIR